MVPHGTHDRQRRSTLPVAGSTSEPLGLTSADVEHAAAIASRLLVHESVLNVVDSAVGLGRLIGDIADAQNEPGQFLALDALLDLAERGRHCRHDRRHSLGPRRSAESARRHQERSRRPFSRCRSSLADWWPDHLQVVADDIADELMGLVLRGLLGRRPD
jgi:hypothetical protein